MNTLGRLFRVSIFGASHSEEIGIVIDGVPEGIELKKEDFKKDIDRRKSGAKGTTARREEDIPEIKSGVFEDITTGSPVIITFKNDNINSNDYSSFYDIPRPGHADYAATVKWNGRNDLRGGGIFSGRMTLPIVAAGAVAKKILKSYNAIESITASLIEIGGISYSKDWHTMLNKIITGGDSIGGIVECIVNNPLKGIGEPFFDSLESLISHAVFSIPGVRGIEFGDGFKAASMKGSEHNDPLDTIREDNCIVSSKNGAGGINGGISNGNPIIFRVAFKPTSSIAKAQQTYNIKTKEMTELHIEGRHDACFALRTPVIVEAMTAIVLTDCFLVGRFDKWAQK